MIFISVLFAGPRESPHVVDSVGPGDAHHLAPSVEQEVALLVVVARLPVSVVRELSSSQALSTCRVTDYYSMVMAGKPPPPTTYHSPNPFIFIY